MANFSASEMSLTDLLVEAMTFVENIIILALILWHVQKVLEIEHGAQKEAEPAAEEGATETGHRTEVQEERPVAQDRSE
jgi:hypothetical protein